ncbi:MAG TPA: ABC transporter permease [Chloroflexota bacterium]|nr:ABC transporter permease [Chloroflexota bacterium]
MNLAESLRVALGSLVSNKMRSALTMLGIIIGVGAVIALMSVGRGAQAMITNQIRGMGTNLLFITPGAARDSGVRQAQGSAPTLTFEDAEAMSEPGLIPEVVAVAPEMSSFGQVIAGANNVNTRVTGVTAEYETVRNFHAAIGTFITKQNVDSKSSVAVLGANVAASLFPEQDPLDQSVDISFGNRRIRFRVIGVLESKGSQAMGNQDDLIFVPLTTLQSRVFVSRTARGGRNVSTINVQVTSEDPAVMAAAVQNIGDLLRERHHTIQDDFTIMSQEDMLATANQVTGVMTMLLGAIAGISLVVGGIGIMNIMLVSVTERTREIGIRKAVGAKRRDILVQFLVESVVVSVAGGAIGVIIGTGLSSLIGSLDLGGQKIPAMVAPDAILLAFGVSTAIGVFFGIYPASRAARLNPIEALRYE